MFDPIMYAVLNKRGDPGGGLPHVTLVTKCALGEETEITEAEASALCTAYDNGTPISCSITTNIEGAECEYSTILTRSNTMNEGFYIFVGTFRAFEAGLQDVLFMIMGDSVSGAVTLYLASDFNLSAASFGLRRNTDNPEATTDSE